MPLTARTRELADALARELATSIAAATGATADVNLVPETDTSPRWLLSVAIDGGDGGQIVLGLDAEGARAATRVVMGFDEEPSDEAVVDTLREFGSQAAGTVGQEPVNVGLRFEVALELTDQPAPLDAMLFTLEIGAGTPLVVAAWGEVIARAKAAEAVATMVPGLPIPPETGPIPGAPSNLDVILDVDLPISVRFGMTEMALQALTRIGPGSVIDLARSPDDPVELLISGKVVARGEVVVVMGNYGVRITEVVSTADRIRSMGAAR